MKIWITFKCTSIKDICQNSQCCSDVAQNQSQQTQTNKEQSQKDDKMEKANQAAGEVLKIRMEQQDGKRYDTWQSASDSDIIVVSGIYDHVEDVLSATRTPYSLITPGELSKVKLKPTQLLIINCPGKVSREAIEHIHEFVKKGGYLFTTDWCLLNVLEEAFPGFIKYTGNPTKDDIVEIQVLDKKNPLLTNVMDKGATPCWWLEVSSYPIKILNKSKVHVLITSQEMDRKYGEPSIAVTFPYGDGKIIHMTSHFYLQRSDTRYERQNKDAKYYVEDELNVKLNSPDGQKVKEQLDGLNLGEVENCYTTQQFIINIVIERKETQK